MGRAEAPLEPREARLGFRHDFSRVFLSALATNATEGRVKFVGITVATLVVVEIAAPLGDEAISIISLRRANRKERKTMHA